MTVKCINQENDLTVGKIYTVNMLEDDGDTYVIVNDAGDEKSYPVKSFVIDKVTKAKCIKKFNSDLTLNAIYDVVSIDKLNKVCRVIDDSGEDFLYEMSLFKFYDDSAEQKYKFYGWQNADCAPVDSAFAKIKNPCELYDYLSKIWSADTCAPRMRNEWNEQNKTAGQCSITSFLAQDIFGGKVYGIELDDGNYHCYNVTDNCIFDLTSEQFGEERLCYNLESNPEQKRDVHFAKEEKKQRYEYLKSELLKLLK